MPGEMCLGCGWRDIAHPNSCSGRSAYGLCRGHGAHFQVVVPNCRPAGWRASISETSAFRTSPSSGFSRDTEFMIFRIFSSHFGCLAAEFQKARDRLVWFPLAGKQHALARSAHQTSFEISTLPYSIFVPHTRLSALLQRLKSLSVQLDNATSDTADSAVYLWKSRK